MLFYILIIIGVAIYLGLSLVGKLFDKALDIVDGTLGLIGTLIKGILLFAPVIILFIYSFVIIGGVLDYSGSGSIVPTILVSAVLALLMYLTDEGVSIGVSGAIATAISHMIVYLLGAYQIIGMVMAIIIVWVLRSVFLHISSIADEEKVAFSIFVENKLVRFISVAASIIIFVLGALVW